MKQLFTFCIALVCQFSLSAQDDEYHPLIRPGLEWNVTGYSNFDYIFPSFKSRFFFGSDTLIDNHTYTKILYHPFVTEIDEFGFPGPWLIAGNTTIVSSLYIRENLEERQVFLYDSEGGEEGLIYDFSLTEGDTLEYYHPWGIGSNMVISSIDTVLQVNGEERKVFTDDNGSQFVEGLGGIEFGLQFPMFGYLSGGFYDLGCISENDEVLWGAPAGSSCGLYLSSSDVQKDIEISIFPNPVLDVLTIELPENYSSFSLSIIDVQGRDLLNLSGLSAKQEVDISELLMGIYILEVNTDNGGLIQKKFVKGN